MFGHEKALPYVNTSTFNQEWIEKEIKVLKSEESDFLALKFAMQTAYTRMDDYRNSLPLAISLSSEAALDWLVIIDKVRLIAENYSEHPVKSDEMNEDEFNALLEPYNSTLNLRMLEFMESVHIWIVKRS